MNSCGGDNAKARIGPAGQNFKADNVTGRAIDDGLQEGHDVFIVDGFAQVDFDETAATDAVQHAVFEIGDIAIRVALRSCAAQYQLGA